MKQNLKNVLKGMFVRPRFTQPHEMVNRPPKPPCWRDFVPEGGKASKVKSSRISKSVDFTELAKIPVVKIPVVGEIKKAPKSITASSSKSHNGQKEHKKSNKKLHRTRSQSHIEQTDLPEEGARKAQSLAVTNPKDLELRKRVLDARLYLDENTRRCAEWLEGVKACEPLEDVAFAQGSGVDVEVPDERTELRPPQNSSASSSDLEEVHAAFLSRDKRGRSYIYNQNQLNSGQESDGSSRTKRDKFAMSNKENHSSSSHEHSQDSRKVTNFQYSAFCVDHTDIKLQNT